MTQHILDHARRAWFDVEAKRRPETLRHWLNTCRAQAAELRARPCDLADADALADSFDADADMIDAALLRAGESDMSSGERELVAHLPEPDRSRYLSERAGRKTTEVDLIAVEPHDREPAPAVCEVGPNAFDLVEGGQGRTGSELMATGYATLAIVGGAALALGLLTVCGVIK